MCMCVMQRSAWEAEFNASLSSLEQVPCLIFKSLANVIVLHAPKVFLVGEFFRTVLTAALSHDAGNWRT